MGWFSDIYQSVDNFLGGNYSAPEYSQAIGPTQPAAPPQTNYALGAGNGNSGSSGGSGLNLNQLLGAGALGAGTNALGAYLASNTQQNAANNASQVQQNMFNQTYANQSF